MAIKETQLSPRMVARAIGVSESSLKRWCDQGLLKTSRTAGGHRRVQRSEVIRFVRERQLEVAEPEVIGLPRLEGSTLSSEPKVVQLVKDALVRGEEEAVRKLMLSLYVAGWDVARIFDDVIALAFQSIGDMWQCGDLEIYQERHGCEIIMSVLREIRSVLPSPQEGAPVAIGASLSGDHYSIPSMMVEMTLTSLGWKASSLGTNLPLESLRSAAVDYNPSLFWISLSHIEDVESGRAEKFLAGFNAFATTLPSQTALVLGGRAITGELRKHLNFTVCFDTMKQLNAYVNNPNHFTPVPKQM